MKTGVLMVFSKGSMGGAPVGRLLSLSEPHGERVSLSYNSSTGKLAVISTALAGAISLSRNASGQVAKVTRVRDGLSYTFAYDANGKLVSSADFDGNTTLYEYTAVGSRTLLSAVEDPLHRRTTYAYYPDGRAHTQSVPGNAQRTFVYGTGSTQFTDIDNTVTTYNFDSQNRVVQTAYPNGATVRQTWTDQNELASTTDALGATTQLGYDSHGNLTSILRPEDSRPTLISYDVNFAKPTNIIPQVGSPLSFSVSTINGDVTAMSRSDGNGPLSLTIGFDTFGNPIQVNNGITTYGDTRDANGLVIRKFDLHNVETRSYDARARVITRTFQNGRVISYRWDNFDRIIGISDSSGPSFAMSYDVMGRLLSRTVSDGHTSQMSRYQYDDRDRLVAVTDPAGRITQFGYDQASPHVVLDRPSRITDPAGSVTTLAYDSMQRLVRRTMPDGSVTRFEYNLRGDMTALVDSDGNRTVFDYDDNRRVIERDRPSVLSDSQGVVHASLEITRYRYDDGGRLVRQEQPSLADGSLLVTELAYDGLDRVVRKIQKREDAHGGVLEVQDDSNFSYVREFDVTRLASANNGVENLSFTYENAPPFANTSYAVHAAQSGNPLQIVEGSYQVARSGTGDIASVALGGSNLFSAQYDQAGRLTSIGSNFVRPGLSAALQYDGFGRRSNIAFSTGLTGQYAYDILNRVTQIGFDGFDGENDNWRGYGKSFSETLSYDIAGNVSAVSRELGNFTYRYDATNQLVASSFTAAHGFDSLVHGENSAADILGRNFTYDANGNRVGDTIDGPSQIINNFLVQNQNYSFLPDSDGLGSVASKRNRKTGISDSFAYRADRKLVSFARTQGDNDEDRAHGRGTLGVFFGLDRTHDDHRARIEEAQYFYDALGRRVAKRIFGGKVDRDLCGHDHGRDASFIQSFVYLSDQDKILLARDGRGDLSLYLDGLGIDEHLGKLGPRGVKAFIADHLGSVINGEDLESKNVTGAFGESLDRHIGLFGNGGPFSPIAPASDPAQYGFAGRSLDLESGLYYNRARMYDPSTGRFLQSDPIGFAGGDENLYRYVGNRPAQFVDPSGLMYVQPGLGLTFPGGTGIGSSGNSIIGDGMYHIEGLGDLATSIGSGLLNGADRIVQMLPQPVQNALGAIGDPVLGALKSVGNSWDSLSPVEKAITVGTGAAVALGAGAFGATALGATTAAAALEGAATGVAAALAGAAGGTVVGSLVGDGINTLVNSMCNK